MIVPDNACANSRCGCSGIQPAETVAAGAAPRPGFGEQTVLRIDKMDCPTEEALIRTKLAGVAGIHALDFNLLQRRLILSHAPATLPAVLAALHSLGFEAVLERADAPGSAPAAVSVITKSKWPLMAVSGIAATLAEAVHWAWAGSGANGMVIALSLTAVLSGGLQTYKKGWIALKNRNLNINALMAVAVTGAMAIGQWPEAAMVMFLFALAELIETLSLDRARNAIHQLMAMAPETATVRQADGSWRAVPAKQVEIGSLVRVRPGERIALDGVVTTGESTVNQAPITGESLPVEKQAGDPVFAGSINAAGAFELRVTAVADDSTLARIIHAVEAAQGSRAPTQRFVDRFARVYTPAVFAFALAVAVMAPLAFGAPWLDWVYRALVLLVIACPCALVISTPVTVVSGLAAAARHGILIKGGAYLEAGRQLKALALDKTGTLTHGKPVVVDFMPFAGADAAHALQRAASLAARSDHPVSKAVLAYADGRSNLMEPTEFAALVGRGVKGRFDGRGFHLGNHRLVEELGVCSPPLEVQLEALERQGKTAVVLVGESGVLAIFAVADTLRATSRAAIDELTHLGVHTVMLTGDNTHTAQAIAAQADIDDVRAGLLPEDKLAAVDTLAARYGEVGMVGDGINDAPALAKATIGFAMGAAGSDTALETADVALMDDDLRKLPAFIRLSRRTVAILRQNITLALGIKALFLALALLGKATLWMAVFADMGVSLLVVFNGLRLLHETRAVLPPASRSSRLDLENLPPLTS